MLTEMNLSSENEINSDDKSNQINLKKNKKTSRLGPPFPLETGRKSIKTA